MKPLASNRRGIALAVALAAIVIIGGLIAGAFFASTQEYRIGRNTLLQSRALTAAEYGLNGIMAKATDGWNRTWNSSKGGLVATRTYDPGDGSSATVRVTGLGNGYFQIVSEGNVGTMTGATARTRIAAIANVTSVNVNVQGALTTQSGNTKVSGSVDISGADHTITGWDCPPPGSTLPGIALGNSATVDIQCGTCVEGNPPYGQTAGASDDATYTQFGGASWDDLAAMADRVYPAGTTITQLAPVLKSDGSCDTGVQSNWGDPMHTLSATGGCTDFYPIVHVTGDLNINGGTGQGILLVDGDLTAQGNFNFFGPVIVKGTLKVTGTGAHFNGGVLAKNADLDNIAGQFAGNAVVNYSACAVQKAVMGATWPRLAKGPSWTEMY